MIGKNVALKRKSGSVMTVTRSKSCHFRMNVVIAVPDGRRREADQQRAREREDAPTARG